MHADGIDCGWLLPSWDSCRRVRLIIIDSVAALFRVDYDHSQGRSRAAALFTLGQRLKALSAEYNTPVVCLNQVGFAV